MKTPAPPLAVTEIFPFLAGRERTTWRMHPRRADDLDLFANKIGGRIAWPRDESTPRCADKNIAAVPVLQLRRDSGLPMPFPDDTDLVQLLWYPAQYGSDSYLPRLVVRYRRIADLAEHTVLEAAYTDDSMGYEVQSCALTFEPVTEYPYIHSITGEERDAIEAWQEARDEPRYQYLLSTCPGSKVGGYADFAGQFDASPASPWEYVLTLSDREWDGGSGARWKPTDANESDNGAIGTYLKDVIVFVDRTVMPWRFKGVL